ncbi:MAG: M14 family metallopeptidase [bacterium]|nr:M14 family metallopeptidase [bacterium]
MKRWPLRSILMLMILVCAAACQNAQVLPSATATPTPIPRSTLAMRPTNTPNRIGAAPLTATPPIQTPTLRESSFVTQTPGIVSVPLTESATPTPPPFPTALMTLEAPLAVIIGESVEGRAITAQRFGMGDRVILLVGGIHGGWEANTVTLIEQLSAHFAQNPDAVRPEIAFVLIPVVNPDGLVRGAVPAGRFNANGVDLNRNWACEWSPDAVWRTQQVNPGPRPMSEPETQLLSRYIEQTRPAVVLFYHSAAAGIFAGACDGEGVSAAMAAVYGRAAGYRYGQPFTAYPVSGTAASWVDGLGIPSADVELETHDDPEFERNLAAILALQTWVIENGG